MMAYKSEIGGNVLRRKDFLRLWCAARDGQLTSAHPLRGEHAADALIAAKP
jgi:hypothetical protein